MRFGSLCWMGGAGFKPDRHYETGDDVAGSTSREALAGVFLAMAAFSLMTLFLISCGGADMPTSTLESGSGEPPATSTSTLESGSREQPATSQAISALLTPVVTVRPVTTVPTPTAAAAANETATPPAAARPTPTSLPSPVMADPAGGITMGGGALGGNADTVLLAQQVLQDLSAGDLVWAAYETRLKAGAVVRHSHEFAFVYAISGRLLFNQGMPSRTLQPNQGDVITANVAHRHGAIDGDSIYWEVILAAPGSGPPPTSVDSRLIFESGTLQDIPGAPLATSVLVRVPPGGQTSVHTHPGPELIYQLEGRIDYENALIGVRRMEPGGVEGIPPNTPVQKRNPYDEEAAFLSWFLVDTSQPFASAARFESPEAKGNNLALAEMGATIVGVSSIFWRREC